MKLETGGKVIFISRGAKSRWVLSDHEDAADPDAAVLDTDGSLTISEAVEKFLAYQEVYQKIPGSPEKKAESVL